MRQRLALLVGATTLLVLVAFLVPLGVLIRTMVADQVMSAATRNAQTIAQLAVTVDREGLALALDTTSWDATRRFPVTVYMPDGTTIGESAAPSDAVELARQGESVTAEAPGGREILIAASGLPDGTAVVRTFVSDEQLSQGVVRSWVILGLLGLCLLAVGLVVADRLGRSYVTSLRELDDTARRLAAGDLDARARAGGSPELAAVAGTLNALAGRIRELLAAERERIADLSHRMRTPLTVLRVDAEALSSPAEAERIGNDVAALERAVDQVIRDGRRPMRNSGEVSCDLAAVVRDRVEFWRVLAEEEGRTVSDQVPPVVAPAAVSREDAVACLDALLSNVFAHTPEGTSFGVRLAVGHDGRAFLTVEDAGPGIADARAGLARGESGGDSTGLGLDIVRRTAEFSGGGVRVGRSAAGGAEITVEFGPPVGPS